MRLLFVKLATLNSRQNSGCKLLVYILKTDASHSVLVGYEESWSQNPQALFGTNLKKFWKCSKTALFLCFTCLFFGTSGTVHIPDFRTHFFKNLNSIGLAFGWFSDRVYLFPWLWLTDIVLCIVIVIRVLDSVIDKTFMSSLAFFYPYFMKLFYLTFLLLLSPACPSVFKPNLCRKRKEKSLTL